MVSAFSIRMRSYNYFESLATITTVNFPSFVKMTKVPRIGFADVRFLLTCKYFVYL